MALADIDNANNLVELFLSRADQKGSAPFLAAKQNGEWVTRSWQETADQICLIAENLRKLGLKRGDRVCIVSENRPEWCIADIAIMPVRNSRAPSGDDTTSCACGSSKLI